MTQLQSLNSTCGYRHLVIDLGTSLGSKGTIPLAVGRPGDGQNHCRTGKECECEVLCLRRGSPLACWVMCFVSSSSCH